MKMKHLVAVLLVVLLMFTGCGGATGDSSTSGDADKGSHSDSSNAGSEPQSIVVGRWGGNEAETAAFSEMTKAFTEKTGIEVVDRVYSDYNTELQAALIGGEGPDVFYVDGYMAPFYISQGILLPLDPDTFELDQFYQPLKDAFLNEGQYYAVSKDYSTLALYYNKKWVDESELPDSLEDLWSPEFLESIQAKLPEGTAALTYNQDLARLMYIAQNGGQDILSEDGYSALSAPAVEANLKPLFDAAKAKLVVTPQDLGVGSNGDAFGNEKTALMIEGNWELGHLKLNFPDVDFGTTEVPDYNGEKGSMFFTVGYGINSATEKVDAASQFIQFATGQEGMTIWTTGAGVLPSRKDVTESTNVGEDPLKKAHIKAADYATAWQKGVNMDTINNEFKNYINSVVTGDRTLDEALKLIDEEANATIKSNQ